MKRVRARTLVLVNWKGVFYERYSLDEHVTALEGDNGAGKTTVMIAAYVVLMPDMTRLRFSNVGESDATGGDKGVWGRLGDPNRPSYAVVVFEAGKERLVAGVHLERKGEPSVELTPFLITDLPNDVRLQDALLLRSGEEDLVPELGELRENVARFGGHVQVHRTAKEYFAALFERGITPLRLVTDEERTRFNDMLRTSMTGGISRALTTEFRSFLLREETGLADTLVRMRSNLDACRRTRTEVSEAQELEQEISGVYESGHAMFAAALLATRERARELEARVEEAGRQREEALRNREVVAGDLEEQTRERARIVQRLENARGESQAAAELHGRVVAANRIAAQIARHDSELRVVRDELNAAAAALDRAEEVKRVRGAERDRAEHTYQRAAAGLVDLQRGLEELHRRADAHRTVTHRLEEARNALERPELAADEVGDLEARTTAEVRRIDGRRNELDATIGTAEAHAADYRETRGALEFILERQLDGADALVEGRRALQALSQLDDLAARVETIECEREAMGERLRRQQAVRAQVEAVCEPEERLDTSTSVGEAHRETDARLRAEEEQVRDEDSQVATLERERQELGKRAEALRIRSNQWRELDAVATRLEATLGTGLRSAQELEAARDLLDEERDRNQRAREMLQTTRDTTLERIRSLEEAGGVFPDDLLAARDVVGGELLANHFDNVDPSEAGRLQARLGPLADAIVVDDAKGAAVTLSGRDRTVDTIWLVEEGGLHKLVEPSKPNGAAAGNADVIVEQDGIVRTTRVPAAPTLGRKARERVIADLRATEQRLAGDIDAAGSQLAEIASRRRDTALLTREIATLELGDPSQERAQVAGGLSEIDLRIEQHRWAATEGRKRAARLAQRSERLRDILADAYLLDEPDLERRLCELEETLRSSVRARGELQRVHEARQVLGERLEVLRRRPVSEAEIGEMRRELHALGQRREQLFLGLDAIRYVVANRDALEWSDAQPALSAQRELVPAVQAQCDRADSERRAATEAARTAEQTWERERQTWRAVDDRRGALEARRTQAQEELDASGVDDPSDAAVERARLASERLGDLVRELDEMGRNVGETVARLTERLEARDAALREADERLAAIEKEWKPAADLWERLRAKADERNLLTPAITARLLETTDRNHVKLRLEARTRATQVEERLDGARGGEEILDQIRPLLSGQEQTTGDDLLQVWEIVRDWLRRRVPAQVAEVDDPLEALARLRQHLKVLAERLDDQERKLRGASEDVARGIDVHIRRAQRQVHALNRELEGVRFGTIRSMRIRLSREDRMEGVLRALREGSAQQQLFSAAMPIEEALDTLFTRFGGRGATVGQKLLDYREYVDIAVEVQRQASAHWERVNPSRLSTGEAIGVGTALMMVVLTAWEHAANLFRARRSLGTLRLLFLDEANRLSQDNLGVVFELCSVLDLQLMIAAPEVAHAPGCTTYRLVRRETADRGEEVVVSGRRVIGEI